MFDAAVAVTPNPLAGIIVEPLPAALVEDHKTAVIEDFCAVNPRNAALVKSSHAYWTSTRPTSNAADLRADLAQFRAPHAVKVLARRINRARPDAKFTVQWFYDDPILDVICDGEVMHLAIWDYEVVAIVKLVERWSFLNWFKSVVG